MQEFTASLHVNHKQVKTVINAENYSDAKLLIKSQYPYASNKILKEKLKIRYGIYTYLLQSWKVLYLSFHLLLYCMI